MTVGERIHTYRKKLGLSQAAFAKKIGASQSAVYYWESGKRQPRVEQLARMAGALQVPIWELLGVTKQEALLMYNSDAFNTTNYDTASLSKTIKKDVIYEANFKNLKKAYDQLNVSGQREAIKRVSELAEIKKYTE